MHKSPAIAEETFWNAVRGNQLLVTIHKQHPVGPYTVDYVCMEAKLIIEIDSGKRPETNPGDYDQIRSDYLKARGFEVVRFSNREVLGNLQGVLKELLSQIQRR